MWFSWELSTRWGAPSQRHLSVKEGSPAVAVQTGNTGTQHRDENVHTRCWHSRSRRQPLRLGLVPMSKIFRKHQAVRIRFPIRFIS